MGNPQRKRGRPSTLRLARLEKYGIDGLGSITVREFAEAEGITYRAAVKFYISVGAYGRPREKAPYGPTHALQEFAHLLGRVTDVEVAKLAGVCSATVSNRRRELGIKRAPQPPTSVPYRGCEILEKYGERGIQSMTLAELAAAENRDRSSVSRVLRLLGLKTKDAKLRARQCSVCGRELITRANNAGDMHRRCYYRDRYRRNPASKYSSKPKKWDGLPSPSTLPSQRERSALEPLITVYEPKPEIKQCPCGWFFAVGKAARKFCSRRCSMEVERIVHVVGRSRETAHELLPTLMEIVRARQVIREKKG